MDAGGPRAAPSDAIAASSNALTTSEMISHTGRFAEPSFSTDSTELERTMIGLSIAGAWTMSCGEVAVGLDPWKTWQRERAAESCGGRAGQGEARVGERSRGGEAARRRLPWRAAGTQKCGERGCASRAGERRRRPRARRSCVGLFAGQARRRALTGNRRGGRGCAAVHRLLFFDPLVL